MNIYYKPYFIFLKDDEIMEFCIYINDQLFMNVDKILLSRAIKFKMDYNYSLCYLSMDENLKLSLQLLPISKVSLSGLGSEYLLIEYRYYLPSVNAMSFNLAKKKLDRMLQCGKII